MPRSVATVRWRVARRHAKTPHPTRDARGQLKTTGSEHPSRHRNHTERRIVPLIDSDLVQRLIRPTITRAVVMLSGSATGGALQLK